VGAVAIVARQPERDSVFLSAISSRGEKIVVHVPRNAKKRPVWVSARQLASIFPMVTVVTEVASGDANSLLDVQTTAWRLPP